MPRRQPTVEELAELNQKKRDVEAFEREIGLAAPLVSEGSHAAVGGVMREHPVSYATDTADPATIASVQETG